MKTANNILELIGETPMLVINDYEATIYAKLESYNPASSVKDRVALAMIENALECGEADPDTALIVPTSGNTGIGVAMVAAVKKMKCIIIMPDSMSTERQNIIKLLGAELVLTPGSEGMNGTLRRAEILKNQLENAIILEQFSDKSNPKIHFTNTSAEIVKQLDGEQADYFVAGVGTGGTLSGIGKALKQTFPKIKVIAVEPIDSPVISGGTASSHKIQGIGAGFIPDNLDMKLVDSVIRVSYESALETLKNEGKTRGLLIGISSGAAMSAAISLAKLSDNKGKNIVVVLADSAERYLSCL